MLRLTFAKSAPRALAASRALAPALPALAKLQPAQAARQASSWPPSSLNDPGSRGRSTGSGYSWPPSSFSDPSMPRKHRNLVAPRQVRLTPRKPAGGYGSTTRIVDGKVVGSGPTPGEAGEEAVKPGMKARPSFPPTSFNVQ